MENQALFSLKDKKVKIKLTMSSAAIFVWHIKGYLFSC